jgi:hypothetical protein
MVATQHVILFMGELPGLQPEVYTAMVQRVWRRSTPLRSNQWENTSTSNGAVSLVWVYGTPPEIQRAKADV